MTDEVADLLARNKAWAEQVEQNDPGFFQRLAAQQKPRFLWIGCSDSRVPANQITGLMPGEVFVHRNVANVVWETDLNCMSVLEFAIRAIQVRHVIICGHYGCAGVRAATQDDTHGVADHWLSGIRKIWHAHSEELAALPDGEAQARLCELNVRQQVKSLCQSTVMQQAWRRGQEVDVHGWIYGLEDGRIRELGLRVTSTEDLDQL